MNTTAMLTFGLSACACLLAGCATPQAPTQPEQACRPITEREVAALFDRWNASLKTGDAKAVVHNYADHSVLLPTLSGKARVTPAEQEDYFVHFLAKKPSGTIDWRSIEVGCNSAIDIGNYTFTFAADGSQAKARFTYTYRWTGQAWLISSHHSSLRPEND